MTKASEYKAWTQQITFLLKGLKLFDMLKHPREEIITKSAPLGKKEQQAAADKYDANSYRVCDLILKTLEVY